MSTISDRIRGGLRAVPDFPKPGILFQDITPLMADAGLFHDTVEALAVAVGEGNPEYIVGIESRGFVFGAAAAVRLGCGFVMARKPGKLPCDRETIRYALEYGEDGLEIHKGIWAAGTKVAIIDDVLATGGTARAAGGLVAALGGMLTGWAFVLELDGLGGRLALQGSPVHALTSLRVSS